MSMHKLTVHINWLERKQVRNLTRKCPALYQLAAADPHIQVRGIACHIGSQIGDPQPLFDALDQLLALVDATEK